MGAARRPELRLVVGGEGLPGSPIADAARRTFEWRSTLAGAIEMLDERSPAELVVHSAMRIAVQLAEQRVADQRRANGFDADARLMDDDPHDLHWEPAPRGPEQRPLPRSPLSDTLEQTREWRAALGQATAWLEEARTPPEVVLDRAMRRAVDVAARYLADQERRRASSPRPRNRSLLAGKRGLIDASTTRLRALPPPPLDW